MSTATLIRGGEVHDGSGGAPAQGDVLIAGDRIAAVGGTIAPPAGAAVVDAVGLLVAPGFIDVHSHSDYTLLVDPRAVSAVAQGVTLEVVGNCGHGCAPVADRRLAALAVYGPVGREGLPPAAMADYLAALQARAPAVNVAVLAPNGQLRLGAVGLEARAATADEARAMARTLATALDEGAAGFSTGLEYAQEGGATEAEVTRLAALAGRAGGIYATHTRDRDDGALAAVEEAIRTARAAEVELQISHITPRTGEAAIARCLEAALAARAAGQPVHFDMHTRLFGFTHLKNIVPAAALAGPPDEVARRLRDPGAQALLARHPSLISRAGWAKVVLVRSPARPEAVGRTLAELGAAAGLPPPVAALEILAAEAADLLQPMVILKTYSEAQLVQTYRAEDCMIGSDATTLAPDGPLAGEVFYGAYGWAAWFWRRLVRETATFGRAEAIRRLTSLPARVFGLGGRGRLAAGMAADLIAFDPDRFGDRATLEAPNRPAEGMGHVFVNGIHTLADGRPTGRRGGRVLRRGPGGLR